MQNVLSLKESRKAYIIGLIVLGLVALSCILLHFGANMHVIAFLAALHVPNAFWLGQAIVDAVISGGAWLASIEFPVIAPIALTITIWLLDGYGYAVGA